MNDRDIFHAAIEITDPPKRSAFLENACAGDQSRQAHIEGLLAMHERVGGFLETPAVASNGTMADHPTVIGPYKLLQQIGEGGMGTVFLAEQTRPVQRQVALKIVKPGMDSRQVIARFEAERQALALMDHPNIAKVFDAGTIGKVPIEDEPPSPNPQSEFGELQSDGRPFFVMELVKGGPITKYCDDRQLTIRQRLELFVPVCLALQHAHQKGVIHRDLKPSNVLVADYDDRPVPKVIDFGVAKAVGAQLTDRTLFTQFGQIVGTVEYMSPEQAKFNALDIDTRSDIYGLGVLLYELLTGTTPLDPKTLEQAPFDEVLRTIREEEPPTPSNRLSTTAELPAIAANRRLEPKKLSGLVRGELDWIVMKCLEKDRNRRYDTAGSLAADIERYLHDEPVQACPPSAWYRGRKFVQRNRSVLTVTSLTLLLITILGGGASVTLRDRATRSALLQEHVDRALDETKDFYTRDQQPEALAALRRAEALLAPGQGDEQLHERVRQWRTDLALVARLDEIRLEQAAVKNDQFDLKNAIPAYREAFLAYGIDLDSPSVEVAAERIRASAIKDHLVVALDECLRLAPPDKDRLVMIVQLADTHPWRNRFRDAVQRRDKKSLEELARSDAVQTLAPDTVLRFAISVDKLGNLPLAMDILKAAQRRHENAFWINHELGYLLMRKTRPPQPRQAVGFFRAALAVRPGNIGVRFNLSAALQDLEDFSEAEAELRAILRLKPGHIHAIFGLGPILYHQGKYDEAIVIYQEALQLRPDSAPNHDGLGAALYYKGRVDEAIDEHQEAIRLQPAFAQAHNNLGIALERKGRLDDAIAEYQEAIRLKPDDGFAHANLGVAFFYKGQLDKAIAAFKESVRFRPENAQAHFRLADMLHEANRLDEAIDEFHAALQLDPKHVDAHNGLGIALFDQGQTEKAIAAYRKALQFNPDYDPAHVNLGRALQKKGLLPQAIAEYRTAIRLNSANASAHVNLSAALRASGQFDASFAAGKESVRLNPKSAEAHVNFGLNLAQRKKFDQAVAEYQEAIRLKPDFPQAHRSLGFALTQLRRFDEAIHPYKEAVRLRPGDVQDHMNLGTALRLRGKSDEAIGQFRTAIRLKPNLAPAFYEIAVIYHARGEWEEAAVAYRETLQQDPNFVRARNPLALLEKTLKPRDAAGQLEFTRYLLRRNRLADAEAEVRVALRKQPDFPAAQCTLAEILYHRGKKSESGAALQALTSAKSDDPGVLLNLGNTYAALAQWDKAASTFARLRERERDHFWIWYRLALAHLAAGRLEQYRKICQELIDKYEKNKNQLLGGLVLDVCIPSPDAPADPKRLAALAEAKILGDLRRPAAAYYRAGNYEKALAHLEQTNRSRRLLDWEWFVLAMAHHQLGHADEAATAFKNGVYALNQTKYQEASWMERLTENRLRAEAETLLKSTLPRLQKITPRGPG